MKKILAILAIVFMFGGCNYLDFDETSGVTSREDMYKYFNKASQMLVNAYRYIPQDFGTVGDAMRACGSDDAEFGNPNGSIQRLNNGNWSAVATVDDQWGLYTGIRCANEFLESITQADYSKYKDDPNYHNWMRKLELYPYEARMLRAYYFFELARRYGDIAMPLKMLTIEEANTITKTPFAEVINFIVKECDECIEHLPIDYSEIPGDEFGRITKGFAMAIKSKSLLYAASRLHNPSMDIDKWKKSAKAALDIIKLGIYRLDPDGVVGNLESPELVFVRMNGFSNYFERNNFPIRFTEGTRNYISGTYPTQELVDAFQTANGYDIILTKSGWHTEDPYFDVTRPYSNRDIRFSRTVLANGMTFKGSEIEVFKGGADYSDTREKGTPTGYFLRKYIEETTSFVPDALVNNMHHWVVYRYAETLLTYAESMVEAFGDADYKDETFTLSALEAINIVRVNALMPQLSSMNKQQFIQVLQREWRVEFAFEDHRFWDIRRWMIGAETQTQVHKVEIERENGGLVYEKTLIENRVWNDRMYLFPIPQDELFKNTNLNPQNKGW